MSVRRTLMALALNVVAVGLFVLAIQLAFGDPVDWVNAAVIVIAATLGFAIGEWLRARRREGRAQ